MIYTSRGDNFTHPYNRWWGTIQANLTLNKWTINANWNAKEKYFAGENVSFHSEYSNLSARYQFNNMTIGVDWTYIFTKNGYMSGDRTLGQFIDKDLTVFIPA